MSSALLSQLHNSVSAASDSVMSAAWTISSSRLSRLSVEQPLTFSICRVCMFRFLSLLKPNLVHRRSCCVCAHYHCLALCCCSFRQAGVFSITCVHYTAFRFQTWLRHHRGARQLSISSRTKFDVNAGSHLDFGSCSGKFNLQSGTTSGTPG